MMGLKLIYINKRAPDGLDTIIDNYTSLFSFVIGWTLSHQDHIYWTVLPNSSMDLGHG